MSEYVDVAIIENGKVIGSFKALNKTKEKTEKIDDLKNRISMAIKDPVLQQGFEIICREYADLEKENAELKKEVLEVRQHLELTEREWGKDTVKLFHFKTQLTRAKEIIKELMSFSVQLCDCRHTVDFEKTREQAVQFLKEGE